MKVRADGHALDEAGDIDWSRTWLNHNQLAPLLLNEVGTWRYRPEPLGYLPNLYIAGAFCRTMVDVVTLEGAVMNPAYHRLVVDHGVLALPLHDGILVGESSVELAGDVIRRQSVDRRGFEAKVRMK